MAFFPVNRVNSLQKISFGNASFINPLSANATKWTNTLKQFVGKFPTNCLIVFDHFVGLAFKGLIKGNINPANWSSLIAESEYMFTALSTFILKKRCQGDRVAFISNVMSGVDLMHVVLMQ